MIKLLLLDRDGILNKVVMRGTIKSSPRNLKELKFPSDALEIKTLLTRFKKKIAVVTNQPDLSRGLLKKDMHQDIIKNVSEFYSIPTDAFYVCPHDNHHNCKCRKPKTGLLEQALNDFKVKPSESALIGDSNKDIVAAFKLKVKYRIFISNDSNISNDPEILKLSTSNKLKVSDALKDLN